MHSVNGLKPESAGDGELQNNFKEIARILQNSASAVGRIHALLSGRGLLAASPLRQTAQIAIASRCGDGAASGISLLAALSEPLRPLTLSGPAAALCGGAALSAPSGALLRRCEGFKPSFRPLQVLHEQHSFLDMFEQLLLCSRPNAGQESLFEREGVELRATVIAGLTAQVAIEHCGFVEIIKYVASQEIARRRTDIAQFTSRTMSLLGAITEEPLAA